MSPLDTDETFAAAPTARYAPASGVRARITQHFTRGLLTGEMQPYRIGGKYRVLSDLGRQGLLGEGGMGCVYAVYSDSLERACVAKFMLASQAPAGWAERFRREAVILAKFEHPNIVHVYDSGQDGDDSFIIMEYVPGEDLDRWLERPRHWRDTLDVFLQAGRGLAEAHAHGIVHRDFTPRNLRISEDSAPAGLSPSDPRSRATEPDVDPVTGHAVTQRPEPAPRAQPLHRPVEHRRVRVLDFGVAGEGELDSLDLEPARDIVMAATRARIGTPGYMSPEQCRGEPATSLSDQFAFCICLHEALFGVRPFGPLDAHDSGFTGQLAAYERFAAHGQLQRPRPPRGPLRRIHDAVLRRGLQPAAEDRFPDMPALLAALQRELDRDRRMLRRASFAGLVGGGALLGALLGPTQSSPTLVCRPDPTHGAWTSLQREQIARNVADTQLQGRLREHLDSFSERWSAHSERLCEAGLAGTVADVFAQRSCLEHHRAVVERVLATVDDTTVPLALEQLPDDLNLAACSHDPSFATTPAERDAQRETDALLAAAEARLVLGAYPESRALALAAEQRAADDSPARARALHQLARVQTYLDPAAARMTLGRALFLAGKHHLPSLAADLYARLVRISYEQGEYTAQALYYNELLARVAELGTTDDPREADAREYLILRALDLGDLTTAGRHIDALTTARRNAPLFARARVETLRVRLLHQQGDLDGAIAAAEQALTWQARGLGPDNLRNANILLTLAGLHVDRADKLRNADSPATNVGLQRARVQLAAASAAVARARALPIADDPLLSAAVSAMEFTVARAMGTDARVTALGEAAWRRYAALACTTSCRQPRLHLLGDLLTAYHEQDNDEGVLRVANQLLAVLGPQDEAIASLAFNLGQAAVAAYGAGDDALAARLLRRLPEQFIHQTPNLSLVAAHVALVEERLAAARTSAQNVIRLTNGRKLDPDDRWCRREAQRIAARAHR
jgi:serine/threonine protein kinase